MQIVKSHEAIENVPRMIVLIILALVFCFSNTMVYAIPLNDLKDINRGSPAYKSGAGDDCGNNGSDNKKGGGGGGDEEATDATSLEEFVDAYGQLAFDTGKKYGIPYEAILAQGYLESRSSKGPGLSRLAKEAFNFFGMKAGSSWTGPVWTGLTQEEIDGGRVTITDTFRAYPSAQAGFDGYGEFVHSFPRYRNALNYPGDPAQYIRELAAAGWATASNYVSLNLQLQAQVIAYLNGRFPPSSEVVPDVLPPNPGGDPGDSSGCGDTSPDPGDTNPEGNKKIAKDLVAKKWSDNVDAEFQCLDGLWTRESGWNPLAVNDAEGNNDTNKNRQIDYDKGENISETEDDAYGIPQAKPGGKMKANGDDWRTNPTTQINWGLDYIQGRYSTPCAAWAHSERDGWY